MEPSSILQHQPRRLQSLDIFRGLTVMFMIFVNNGAGSEIFSTLQHSKWNGMTPCDLVFPFFIFIMGVSTYLSLKKTQFKWSRSLVVKIVKRTVLLFLIGLVINWFDMACDGRPFDFAHLRIMGVMQRLGLCYGATALIVMAMSSWDRRFHWLPLLIVVLLAGYGDLLKFCGGYNYDSATNILSIVDRGLFGPDHLYHKSPVDPEGLLSTISAIAQTLIGFYVAYVALGKRVVLHEKLLSIFSSGAVLTLCGYLCTFALPLNKRVWSPSYVLVTCGLACLLLGLLIYLIDVKGTASLHPDAPSSISSDATRHDQRPARWTVPPLVFGTNPLLLYVVSELLGIAFGAVGLKMAIYDLLHLAIPSGYWASVCYATFFVTIHAFIGYPLWKRHIFIKL